MQSEPDLMTAPHVALGRLPRFILLLVAGVAVASLLMLPRHWSRNQFYLKMSSALMDGGNPAHVAEVERFLARVEADQTPADYSLQLGQLYLATGAYEQAESALTDARREGSTDPRLLLWLADAFLGQQKLTETVQVLSDELAQQPLSAAAHEALEEVYARYAQEAAHAEGASTAEPVAEPFTLEPGESVTRTVYLPATLPRWIELTCNAEVDTELEIVVDGQPLSVLCRAAAPRVKARVPNEVGAQSQATIRNLGASGVEISDLRMVYLTNVERYDENPNAAWTDAPHKVIRDGKSYETRLRLPSSGDRSLIVRFFNFKGRYLDVSVEGVPVGRIVGGQKVKGYRGGPTPFEFVVPPGLGDEIAITLHCPSESPPGGVAIDSLYLREAE